jgi:hypothetical protein
MLADDHAAAKHYAEIIEILDRADRELMPEDYASLLNEVETEAESRFDDMDVDDDDDSTPAVTPTTPTLTTSRMRTESCRPLLRHQRRPRLKPQSPN